MATANLMAVTHGSGGHANIMAANSPNHLLAQPQYYAAIAALQRVRIVRRFGRQAFPSI